MDEDNENARVRVAQTLVTCASASVRYKAGTRWGSSAASLPRGCQVAPGTRPRVCVCHHNTLFSRPQSLHIDPSSFFRHSFRISIHACFSFPLPIAGLRACQSTLDASPQLYPDIVARRRVIAPPIEYTHLAKQNHFDAHGSYATACCRGILLISSAASRNPSLVGHGDGHTKTDKNPF